MSFGLDSNLWVVTDDNGHLKTTLETPLSFDPRARGYMKMIAEESAPHGGMLTYDNREFVDTTTDWQNVNAKKYFNEQCVFKSKENHGETVNQTLVDGATIMCRNEAELGSPLFTQIDTTLGEDGERSTTRGVSQMMV